jgi:HlyD family secretion protein
MDMLERLPRLLRGRAVLVAAAAAVIAIGLLVILRPSTGKPAPAPAATAMTVTATTLQEVVLARGVIANGSIHPWQEIVVGSEVGGYRVAAVNVDVGDKVKRGQELVRLKDDMLAAEVASKRANVRQAEATLANAAAAYRRAESLKVSGALSQSDLDRLQSEELAARARVEVANAELETAELRLKYTRVTAPDDGVISARDVAVGQIAQVGGEMLRMVRKARVEWRAEIPESRLRDIKVGQAVRLTTADSAQLEGKVRTVSPTVDNSTRSGLVYVDMSSPTARPGMFARGEIVVDHTTAQMLPITSVVIQDGYSFVFVLKADYAVERRSVQTGTVKDSLIEILSGVAPEERVVVKGAGFLKDGDRVRVVSSGVE